MKIDLKLPCIIEGDDYHEFRYLEGYFKILNKNIKIKELNRPFEFYTGIVYFKKFDSKAKKLEKEINNIDKCEAKRYDESSAY